MKKNKMMRAASALLVATLLSTSVISGTFAKYTSTASGSDTATVAKWSFNVGDKDIAKTDTTKIDFDLFKTVKDSDGTTDETDVAGGKKIAPGTSGSFDIKVKNTSEVTAKYTIELEEINTSNIPLQYSLDKTNWVDSIDALTMTGLKDQQLIINSSEATHTVYWRWGFDGTNGAHVDQTDTTDTALGVAAQSADAVPSVTITATVTATQVD